ncbi:hypothetical protein [uncultured Ruminococcus sp.]|uniref:hypothetical protein n=1 Tax=uncultured Ruminococcus sp. TaxID=165186 RepID=UPI00262D5ACD|nr:hypothetical protein [uncultured Ruminococcus sp.]
MEAVAVIAVISVVLLIVGFKPITLAMLAAGLIALGIAAMALFFVYFGIRMLLARSQQAEFSRIAKSPYNRFNVAYYKIGGKEYPNVFPQEGVLVKKLYKSSSTYKVLLDKRGKYVFDRFSITTCIAGLIFCLLILPAAVFLMLRLL